MKLQETFNWLAQRPAKNYTLGEYLAERRGQVIDDNRLNFTRAGRAVERFFTGLGMLGAAGAALAGPMGGAASVPGSLFLAVLVLGVYKGLGVGAGKIADAAVRHNVPRL